MLMRRQLQKEQDLARAKAKSLEDVASATNMQCAPTSSVPAIEAPATSPKIPKARDYTSNQVIQVKVSLGQGLWSPPTGLRNSITTRRVGWCIQAQSWEVPSSLAQKATHGPE